MNLNKSNCYLIIQLTKTKDKCFKSNLIHEKIK